MITFLFLIRAFFQKFKNAWIKRVIDFSCFPADNKELRLKMDFILEENERLKAVIQSMETAAGAAAHQQQH